MKFSQVLKNFAVLIVIIFFLANVFHTILEYYHTHETCTKYGKIRRLKNQELDYVFLGNSRVLVNVPVDSLNRITHLKGYNLGLDGTNIMQHYLMLYKFLCNSNKVKAVFYNFDPWSVQMSLSSKKRIYPFLPEIDDDTIYYHLKRIYGSGVYLWKYLPGFKYGEFNSRIGLLSMVRGKCDRVKYSGDIDIINTRKMKIVQYKNTDRIKIRPQHLRYIEMLWDLCKKNGVRLIIYTSPVESNWYQSMTNSDSIYKAACRFSESNHYNHCNTKLIEDTGIYYDRHHLNQEGVNRYIPYLQNMITETFQNDGRIR